MHEERFYLVHSSLALFVKIELKYSCVSQNRYLAVNGAEVKV